MVSFLPDGSSMVSVICLSGMTTLALLAPLMRLTSSLPLIASEVKETREKGVVEWRKEGDGERRWRRESVVQLWNWMRTKMTATTRMAGSIGGDGEWRRAEAEYVARRSEGEQEDERGVEVWS